MKALCAALVLCCGTVWADPAPSDAPVIILKAGEVAPSDGLLLSPANAVTQAKRVTACEAERDVLKTQVTPLPVWAAVTIGILALGAGIGAGYGLSKLPVK